MRRILKIGAILFSILFLFYCKEAVYNDSTLADNSAVVEKSDSAACCDTVVIQKVTTPVFNVTDVDYAPEILRVPNPIYSMEMIEYKVEGIVKLKLLVGSDGLVKSYIILNDLGHGTNKAIHKAAEKMEFIAARKNGKRASAWINTILNFRCPKL